MNASPDVRSVSRLKRGEITQRRGIDSPVTFPFAPAD